jgi:hypothetical protein
VKALAVFKFRGFFRMLRVAEPFFRRAEEYDAAILMLASL